MEAERGPQQPQTQKRMMNCGSRSSFNKPDEIFGLADALEKAGCTEPAILDHCRGRGPHVLGCWALDLVLGKV